MAELKCPFIGFFFLNGFYSHGETSKFVMPPWTRPLTKTLDLRNLTSQRALDYNDQFWCASE